MKHKKGALLHSIIAILLCISRLAGTTFAWFTDSVSTEGNIIQSGRLKIGMFWTGDLEPESGEVSWTDASEGPIFNYDHWEPGYTDLKYLKLENQGNLAFQYQLTFGLPESADPATADIPGTPAGDAMALAEVIGVYYAPVTQKLASREEALEKLQRVGTLADMIQGRTYTGEGVLLPEGAEAEENVPAGSTVACVMLKMQESAGNEYRDKVAGDGFCLKVLATQYTYEYDSYGKDYDADAAAATFPSYPGIEEDPEGEGNEGSEPEGSEPEGGNGDNPEGGNGDNPEGGNGGNPEGGNPEGGNPEGGNPEGGDPEGDDPEGDDPEGGNTGSIPTDENGKLLEDMMLEDGTVVPAGAQLEEGAEALTLTIEEKAGSDATLELSATDTVLALDVHLEGLSPENDKPIVINLGKILPENLNIDNVNLFHVEEGVTKEMKREFALADVDAHNEFYYDIITGDVTVAMATFSEVALVADTAKAWEGNFDYSWYTNAVAPLDGEATADYIIANADQLAAFGAIVGGMDGQTRDSFKDKTVKLIADINLGKESENNANLIFYPIGYYNSTGKYDKVSGGTVTSSVSSFEGVFDGQGHTISNFYQNTWEMFGDYNNGYSGTPNHYKDAMGLFGYVKGGTVKNLTVDNFSSDGEFTPTGVIAAYADGDSTFENIAITNCNPRVYNTGNGGIIGIAGDTATADDDHISLTNITVDNSNKISALWGSYDVGCGGLVGMYRGNVDGSGNATGDAISFNNCHVSAIMDVYNDVCGNYQYYAYRYAGMIIGSVRHNTTNADGKTIPNMIGISATSCTVNYGDWNDYYYCEFVKNGHPSYSGPDDYKFSRVPHSELNFIDSNGNGVVDANERASVNGCEHTHTAAENHQAIYLPFHQLFTGYSWGVSSIGLEELEGIENITVTIGKEESALKFDCAFPDSTVDEEGNVETKFLYRVGNKNTVSAGSLFKAKDGASINNSGVVVTIDKVDENSNVGGTFTENTSDWTKGTIQFSGTGVVKVTIQDYNFCKPTELMLEVVDAVNATSATSAKANNVVLLNDMGLHTIEVSNGYTLYGNGFKMTAANDVMYDAMGVGFVTLKNGTLDNVQIICPNFSYAIIYTNQIKSSENTAVPSDSSNDARGNVRSAVMADGNSKILNSYVHGGRAAIFLRSGNLLIDNSTISGGAAANIHAISAQSLTLRNATLIQKPFQATVHDTSKTVMGLSGLFECDESGNSTPLILEGTLIQDAWINESYKQYVPSNASSIIEVALRKTDYLHDLDGGGTKESLNLGFTYIPQNTGGSTNTQNIKDERTNKSTVPYGAVDVGNAIASAKVYSYKNTQGTSGDFVLDADYAYSSSQQSKTAPTVTFTDTNADRAFETKFDNDEGRWESTLTVNLDNGDYTFSFDKLLAQKNGENLTYEVSAEGVVVDTSKEITLTSAGVTEYVMKISDSSVTRSTNLEYHEHVFILVATKTSIPEPEVADTTGGTPLLVVKSKNSDWSCAIPALEGIKVKYYTSANNSVTLDLATLTPTSTGKQNGTNNYWETTKDGYKLKVTCGYIHDTKQIYGMPVVVNNGGNKMYFTISSTNGYVSTSTSGRTVTLTYEFTDPNGKTLTFSKTWQFNYADYKNGTQYSYSDFVNGTLKEASSGGCVTPDTLITLADGKQVRVDSLTGSEELLVWNHETGTFDSAPAAYIVNHDEEVKVHEVTQLTFSDGNEIKIIGEHVFFDATLNCYVPVTGDNAKDYINHVFTGINNTNDALTAAKLVEAENFMEKTSAYEVVSYKHLTCFTNNLLSTSAYLDKLLNIFDIDTATMAYSVDKVAADIAKYGLYTYADFEGLISEEAFELYNAAYLKVAVGKGYITWDDILDLIDIYFAVDVKPIQ